MARIWEVLVREISKGSLVLGDPGFVKTFGCGQAAKGGLTLPAHPRGRQAYTFGSRGEGRGPSVMGSSRGALGSQPTGGLSYTFQNFFSLPFF